MHSKRTPPQGLRKSQTGASNARRVALLQLSITNQELRPTKPVQRALIILGTWLIPRKGKPSARNGCVCPCYAV